MSSFHARSQIIIDRDRDDLSEGPPSRIEDHLALSGPDSATILPEIVALKLAHRIRSPDVDRLGEDRYGVSDGAGLCTVVVAAYDEPLRAFSTRAVKSRRGGGAHPAEKGGDRYFRNGFDGGES